MRTIGSQNKHAQSVIASTLAYQNNRRLKNYISSRIELKYREVLFPIQCRYFGVSQIYFMTLTMYFSLGNFSIRS